MPKKARDNMWCTAIQMGWMNYNVRFDFFFGHNNIHSNLNNDIQCAMHRSAPGPNNWISNSDLVWLCHLTGPPCSLESLMLTCQAMQIRLAQPGYLLRSADVLRLVLEFAPDEARQQMNFCDEHAPMQGRPPNNDAKNSPLKP